MFTLRRKWTTQTYGAGHTWFDHTVFSTGKGWDGFENGKPQPPWNVRSMWTTVAITERHCTEGWAFVVLEHLRTGPTEMRTAFFLMIILLTRDVIQTNINFGSRLCLYDRLVITAHASIDIMGSPWQNSSIGIEDRWG